MSYMRGDLLAKPSKLVKGLARAEPVWLKSMESPPASSIFARRVLELKELGVGEEEAMAAADMQYRIERKAKKKAYAQLKQIARLQGKGPCPNPYPRATKEIQAKERRFIWDHFYNLRAIQIVNELKLKR